MIRKKKLIIIGSIYGNFEFTRVLKGDHCNYCIFGYYNSEGNDCFKKRLNLGISLNKFCRDLKGHLEISDNSVFTYVIKEK